MFYFNLYPGDNDIIIFVYVFLCNTTFNLYCVSTHKGVTPRENYKWFN